MKELKVTKCPEEALALRNVVAANPADFQPFPLYIRVRSKDFPAGIPFSVAKAENVKPGQLGFSGAQRAYAKLADSDTVSVAPEQFGVTEYLGSIELGVEFQKKKFVTKERYDVSQLSKAFVQTFQKQVFSQHQPFVFKYEAQDQPMFKITVKNMVGVKGGIVAGADDDTTGSPVSVGIVTEHTNITFASDVVLFAGAGGQKKSSLFDPKWKFEDMGIGGLGSQFREMFRRAFVSRIFPADVVEKLGIQHSKGMMLFGPPGTGKTLMARQIGKMLQGREPKVVNGPEIMSKYVGESEENVRKLFAEAEKEQAERGENSSLHIIIFDEIDAICKQRGSTSGGTGVADSVVNQLLSKIDGVEALNNVLLIGMTNRLDMIDEALLRPGRFELKLQIGLPDEDGRHEIFKIHTKRLTDHNYMTDDVNLKILAQKAKNFSGAEIAGLIRSAVSFATERCVKGGGSVEVDMKKLENLKVTMTDFERALNELKPAFGADADQFEGSMSNGIFEWDVQVDIVLQTGKLLAQQAQNSDKTPLVSMLLCGSAGSGKTALASKIGQDSEFPFIKLISPENYVGLNESAKVSRITKVFTDAYKSVRSVVVIDDIERLIDFNEIGYRYSNVILQALLVLVKKRPPPGHKLFIIGTTGQYDILHKMGLVAPFTKVTHLNALEQSDQIERVLGDMACFDASTTADIMKGLSGNQVKYQSFEGVSINVSIKKLYLLGEMAKQSDEPVDTFLYSLYDECKRNGSSYQ